MHEARRSARGAESLKRIGESFFLLFILARTEIVGRGEMRECPRELQMRGTREKFEKLRDLRGRNAQAVHAGVDFQVKRESLARTRAANLFHGALKQRKLVETRDGRRQVVA